jgi:HK97 family phage prohead protease
MTAAVRPLASEVRYVEGIQLRAEADGRYLDTMVSHYAEWRDVGPFEEWMEPGVFDATLSRHADSIKLVVGHDDRVPAVATPVEWRNTATELGAVYRFGSHKEAQTAAQMADEGMFGGVSVGFLPSRRPEHNVWTKGPGGSPRVRRVQARLLHVGLVTTPADADARILEVRSVGVPDDVVLATPNLDAVRARLDTLRIPPWKL